MSARATASTPPVDVTLMRIVSLPMLATVPRSQSSRGTNHPCRAVSGTATRTRVPGLMVEKSRCAFANEGRATSANMIHDFIDHSP
jgi:hypothetical protein